jgi:hypothetical protein
VPHLTYKGPFYERKSPDPKVRAFRRKERREVSQEWLNAHRRKISDLVFLVEGDEGVHIDEGNDGIPDMSWTKAKIVEWLEDNGSSVGGGYRTKSKLLEMVDSVLNPPAPVVEEPVEEAEEAVEESVEDSETMEE